MAVIQVYVFIFLSIFVGWAPFSDSVRGERWAVLVAGSQGWDNYRHQANVCTAYKILRNGGLKKENIIVFMYDDIAYNPQNPKPGRIYHRKNGYDVYQGVPKDYTGEHVTSENFYNVLRGHKNDINRYRKVLKSGSNDHVFIYYTDHGETNTLYMPLEGDRVHRNEFLSVLNHMHHANLYKQMVVYVDACLSGSMFEDATRLDDMNIFVTTSSNAIEVCYAEAKDKSWNTSFRTEYSYAWIKDSKTHNLGRTTLNQQFERVKKMVAKTNGGVSHVMKYGSQKVGEKHVSDFFWRA